MNIDQLEHQRTLAREVLRSAPPYPEDRFAGRGIVICGGGRKYFTCAWVLINMLRERGCTLPIELWHLGPLEMNDAMRALVAPLDVACIDAYEVRRQYPARRLNGWELKPYAILHSRFREVLFLDADNVPVRNPEFLFEAKEYERTGAIFWPDFGTMEAKNPIWSLAEVQYRFEPGFESGQIVVDKSRCWVELLLTMHYNEYSEVYYPHLGGDKDTFHIAWRRTAREYALIPHHVHALADVVMNQHDFDGELLFHHRNNAKWTLELDANPRIPGFHDEDRCLALLEELVRRWNGDPARTPPSSMSARARFDEIVATRRYVYHRVGYDRRLIELRPDQSISGGGALENSWFVTTRENGDVELCLAGMNVLTCSLAPDGHGSFTGRWALFERMPIELTPAQLLSREEVRTLELEGRKSMLFDLRAVLIRHRRDTRFVRLERNGDVKVIGGGARSERWRWSSTLLRSEHALELIEQNGDREEKHLLFEEPDGVFREDKTSAQRPRVELVPVPWKDKK